MGKTPFIIVLILITSNVFYSQLSLLDDSYGDQGIVSLEMMPSHGSYYVSLDKEGRYYLGFQDYLDPSILDEIDYKFLRVDANGNFDQSLSEPLDLGIEMAITEEFSPIQRMIYEDDEFIFAYQGPQNNSSSTVDVFNTEKEKIITLDLGVEPISIPWATRPARLSNGQFYVTQEYQVRRYLDSGELDENFGINGVVDFRDLVENVNQAIVPMLQKQGSNHIYFTRIQTTLDAFDEYKYSIGRLNLDGELDLDFAENGYLVLPGDIGTVGIFSESDDVLQFTLVKYTQPIYAYSVLRTNSKGEVITEYGDNGLLIDTTFNEDLDAFFGYNLPVHTFSDKSILIWSLEYYNDLDSILQASFSLSHFNADGLRNLSFGDNGKLSLDFIPNRFLHQVDVDEDRNIYLFGYDYQDTILSFTNHKLYKLDGEKLFGPRSTGVNPHNFEVVHNPVSDKIIVKYSGPGADDLVFQLYDSSGKLIFKKSEVSLSDGELNVLTDVRLGYLTAGTYMLRVTSRLSGISEVLRVVYMD